MGADGGEDFTFIDVCPKKPTVKEVRERILLTGLNYQVYLGNLGHLF